MQHLNPANTIQIFGELKHFERLHYFAVFEFIANLFEQRNQAYFITNHFTISLTVILLG